MHEQPPGEPPAPAKEADAHERAGWQFATSRRIVSGASTLTMQVARLLEPRPERNLTAKLTQAGRAVELERRFTKGELLDLYLRLAPYGGTLEGVRAASLSYFGKEPKRLSIGEAALLVALPQSPERRRPDRQRLCPNTDPAFKLEPSAVLNASGVAGSRGLRVHWFLRR